MARPTWCPYPHDSSLPMWAWKFSRLETLSLVIGRPQIHDLFAVALLKPVVGSSHCAWVRGVQPLVVMALRAYSAAFL